MGVFGLVKRVMQGNRIVTVDAGLGNVLLAGVSPRGMRTVITNYAIDALNRDFAVVIFRDAETGFSACPSLVSSGSLLHEINNEEGAISDQIDPFSCFSDTELNAYLMDMFDTYSEMEKTKRMSFQAYVTLMRSLLKKKGKNLRLNEYANYSIDDVDHFNLTTPMPQTERDRNERFLNGIRPDIRELEAYFYEFSQNTIGEILSGNRTMEKIFQTRPVIEINLDFSSKPKESEMLMKVMVDNIAKMNLSMAGKSSVAVIASEIPNDILIKTKFNKLIRNDGRCHVVYTVADISNLVEQDNVWIDYADSYFFFKQNSNKNKEFCSEFFGTYERTRETTTTGINKPTFWEMWNGKGVVTKQRSTSYTTEKERVYLPDVFANLLENQAIYYFKNTNEHSRLTVF